MEQFGIEVTSSRFCAVYNLGMKLLQANLRTIKPKSVIRLLCANKLSFCHLPFRFSVAMEPHCALKT